MEIFFDKITTKNVEMGVIACYRNFIVIVFRGIQQTPEQKVIPTIHVPRLN